MSAQSAFSLDALKGVHGLLTLLASELGLKDDPPSLQLLGTNIHTIVKKFCDATLLLDNQEYIKPALALLTRLSMLLAPESAKALNDKLVAVLYNKMNHRETNLLSDPSRQDDGKFRESYARSVETGVKQNFPDEGLVFDKLLKRSKTEDTAKFHAEQPDGLSSLTFAFGTLVIHSVFDTERGCNNNTTSSYFNLSPLYGDDTDEEAHVRDKAQGRGLLHPDCFYDPRMLFLPPAAAALLVVFNRNHNEIAKKLLENNERRTWSDPPPRDAAALAKQDDEIFETARRINCHHFVNVVITDYVGGVMGVPANGGGWPGNAEVFHEMVVDNKPVSRGDGNRVSIEFNILYRWHATLSMLDTEWIEGALFKATGRNDWDQMTPETYEGGKSEMTLNPSIKDRTFSGLKRGPNGRFDDKDISEILYKATEAPSGIFRARGSPAVMKAIDMLGIRQARKWEVCTLNEFRQWLRLDRYKSFTEWNADPEIAKAAEELYKHIDNLELYPGLHAEGRNGDGFNVDYPKLRVDTMRNGLLFDAIALLRGDPGLTTNFNPESLTQFGLEDVKREHNNRAFGGHIHKIFTRTLPNNYPADSIYTWFPMSTPTAMKSRIKKLGPYNWNFDRPTASS